LDNYVGGARMNGPLCVCVIGANGFIGKRAVATLAAHGFNVRATVRDKSQLPPELCQSSIQVVFADVNDPSTVEQAVDGMDIVVNCAGIYRWWIANRKDYERVNIDGAAHIAHACLKASSVKRLIHISTAMSFGYPKDKPFNESSFPGPHASTYARTKHLGDEKIKHIVSGQTKLGVVTLFLACVTGKGDTFGVGRPAAVYRDFMSGNIPMLVAPDTNYIYVHIRDVELAITAACTLPDSKVCGQDYLIGNSKGMLTTRQFFQLLSQQTGRPCPRWSLNLSIGYWLALLLTWIATYITRTEPIMPVDIMRTAWWGSIEYDCSKSEAHLGIQYTPIDIAISESIQDVRQRM